MTSKAAISDFTSQRTLAIVGMSRSGKKFGNAAYKTLQARGYTLYPVHPTAETIDGARCYPSLSALPAPVGGVLVAVPPAQTEAVVREAAQAGITRVWMQQGAESPAAIHFCEEHGISAIHGECILMFTDPVGFPHGVHRWVNKVTGKLPR